MSKKFCSNCGCELPERANFCSSCGENILGKIEVTQQNSSNLQVVENPFQRQTVFEGNMHKCPNCGELIASFLTTCVSCGYEFRDIKSASSVQNLALKLEMISSQRLDSSNDKRSIMQAVFGNDFTNKNKIKEAEDRFKQQKEEEKASLIINFAVPNSKEDILEFMILADSNINLKEGIDDAVSKAWISKLDQVYKKAEISMSSDPDFLRIKEIYLRKKKELKIRKVKFFLLFFVWIGIVVFIPVFTWNPILTILIILIVIAIVAFGIFKYIQV